MQSERHVAELADYQWLVSDERAATLLAELAQDAQPSLGLIDKLRQELPSEQARLIVQQLDLRRRAAAKFGSAASRMFFTPVHLEQATDIWVATYKARRLSILPAPAKLHDFCCGIGGDAAAFATYSLCNGYDHSHVACLLAEANVRRLGGERASFFAHAVDVATCAPGAAERWHVDPDRRAAGQRSTRLDLHSPPPELIDSWRNFAPSGAVKLAPGAVPPVPWEAEGELEWISRDRECRQLVVWFGGLAIACGQRTATIVQTDPLASNEALVHHSFTATPIRGSETAEHPGPRLFDPDPSLIAAGLVGAFANRHSLASLGSGGVYLTGDVETRNPLLQTFEVLECLPLRAKVVAGYLAQRGVGRVEIKKRGVDVDPERFRRELKLRGESSATVILTRIGKRQLAIVAERLN